MGLTAEQFNEWIERAEPEARRYVAAILRKRGSTGPTLKIKPGRNHPRALSHGQEEEILATVVLKLLEGDPPPYATKFYGTYPEDYPQFKTWFFTWLENETGNETRRHWRKRRQEVSTEETDWVKRKVDQNLDGEDRKRVREREKHEDRVEQRAKERELNHGYTIEALNAHVEQDVVAEYGRIEEDNREDLTSSRVRQTEPVEYRDDPLGVDDLLARVADFPRSHVDVDIPEPKRVGRPRKWTEEEARQAFFEYATLQSAILSAYGAQLGRAPDESAASRRGRVAAMLLELDREYVHGPSFTPFAFWVRTPHPNDGPPEPGVTRLGHIYDPVYRDLTEDAAAEIATTTPARADALALALLVYYRERSAPTVKHVLAVGRALTPGTVRQRCTRT